MIQELVTPLSEISKAIIDLVKNHADAKRLEENKFRTFVLFVRELKYYKLEGQDSKTIILYLDKIADYLKTYYDDRLSTLFVSSLKDIYWSLRYNSDITEPVAEGALEPFINELRKRKFKVN